MHCKDTIPKIRNKYAQESKCTDTVPIPTFIINDLCLCERFIYSPDRSAYSAAGKKAGPKVGILCLDRSQTHECGNWD
jgi:hypothetical protein